MIRSKAWIGMSSLVGVVVEFLVSRSEDRIPAEQVDRHALDRADVDEGVTGVGVRSGRHSASTLGSNFSSSSKSSRLEPLAVDLVDLVELQARLRLERSEGPHRLGRECPTIHEEQHAPRDAGLHQPIDLVDHRERLARAGRHRDEHLPLPVGDSLFNGRVRFDLVWAQPWVVVRSSQKFLARGIEVLLEPFHQGFRGVKLRDDVRPTQFVSDVVMPDTFAIGRI